jgi:hypothetical protein
MSFYRHKYIYTSAGLFLFTTSLALHSYETHEKPYFLYAIDKVAIILVVLCGFGMFILNLFRGPPYILGIIVSTFIGAIYIYTITLDLMDKDDELADVYHAYMHFISCMGHCLLVLL